MLNIAIIGTGSIANAHMGGYKTFPDRCRVAALVDCVVEKAFDTRARYNLDADVYASHKDILDRNDIDLVSICTPPFCHAQIAIDCLKAGFNVIVEKPMAASLEECDAMIAARDQSGRILSVVAQNRFMDSVANIKTVVDSGKIGRILHTQVDSFWWRGHSYYDLWWRGRWDTEGGGCTLNHAVHQIDMLLWMLGSPQKVMAMISNANHDNSEVEDISAAVLSYPGGALAQITSSVIHHGEDKQLIFQGERARVSMPWKVVASLSKPNGFPEPNPALEAELNAIWESLPTRAHTGHTGQIDNVMTALETGGQPLIGGEDGRRTIELITAIFKAGTVDSAVALPLLPSDPFYTADGILKNIPRFYQKTTSKDSLGAGDITLGTEYERKG